jgi:hypothetical protein
MSVEQARLMHLFVSTMAERVLDLVTLATMVDVESAEVIA